MEDKYKREEKKKNNKHIFVLGSRLSVAATHTHIQALRLRKNVEQTPHGMCTCNMNLGLRLHNRMRASILPPTFHFVLTPNSNLAEINFCLHYFSVAASYRSAFSSATNNTLGTSKYKSINAMTQRTSHTNTLYISLHAM